MKSNANWIKIAPLKLQLTIQIRFDRMMNKRSKIRLVRFRIFFTQRAVRKLGMGAWKPTITSLQPVWSVSRGWANYIRRLVFPGQGLRKQSTLPIFLACPDDITTLSPRLKSEIQNAPQLPKMASRFHLNTYGQLEFAAIYILVMVTPSDHWLKRGRNL